MPWRLLTDRAAEAALQVVEDAGEVGVQRRLVAGEQEYGGGEGGQDQEMQNPVDGDQPQDVPVAQRPAAQREGDLLARRRVPPGRLAGRAQHHPGVAAQAPVPAQPARLPGEEVIAAPKFGRVRAE